MIYKIVLVRFPFNDLLSQKVRPALCLSNEVEPYGQVVLAFITSRDLTPKVFTDFGVKASDKDFPATGLKVSSTIRLHSLMTVSKSLIARELGELPISYHGELEDLLLNLFYL